MKSEKQKISEALLLLRILQRDNNIFGNLKLQKEVFLTELKLLEAGLGGLYYRYFRYNYGPYSRELAESFKWLAERSFIHKTTFTLTERGLYLVELTEGVLRDYKQNPKIFDAVDSTVDEHRRHNGYQLTQVVYNTKVAPHDVPGEELKVKDIPMFCDILVIEDFENAAGLAFPPSFLDTLKSELEMDRETWESLPEKHRGALRRAKKRLQDAVAN